LSAWPDRRLESGAVLKRRPLPPDLAAKDAPV
jgi:hypothetical protein